MRKMNYFSEHQPIEGKIAYVIRESLRESKFAYGRYFSLNGDGLSTLIKVGNNIYEVKVTQKKNSPKFEPVKESEKKMIVDEILTYCEKVGLFNYYEKQSLGYINKGFTFKDGAQPYTVELIKKRNLILDNKVDWGANDTR